MPIRKIPLVADQFYHVYNRGVARQPVFLNKREYERFLLSLRYYRYNKPPLKLSRFLSLPEKDRNNLLEELNNKKGWSVEIISFVLMPNHFHLLLKQKEGNGISTFMRRAINSYTRYFNTKHARVGSLFQGVFKAIRVETDEQLIHLSRYIDLNPLVSYVVKDKDFMDYPWSSLSEYLKGETGLIESKYVLSHFRSVNEYKKFVLDQKDYAKELEKIKHLVIEKQEIN